MDIFWEVEQALTPLAWECAVYADAVRLREVEGEEAEYMKECCVDEYERARDDIDDLKHLVRVLGNHKGEPKFCMDWGSRGDRIFRESYARHRYKIKALQSKHREAHLLQEDYKAAALDILQMSFDRLDAAILFDKVGLRSLQLRVEFVGRQVPVFRNMFETMRFSSNTRDDFPRKRGAYGLSYRIIDPEDFYMGMRLVSYYQYQRGFVSASLAAASVDDEFDPVLTRAGSLSDFKLRVRRERKVGEAYYLATNYHRAEWYEYALGATEAYRIARKRQER